MLARSAQGLYWLGRYLERAEHVCKALQLQVSALVDRPVEEIQFGWRRIYLNLKRMPPGGLLAYRTDALTLADSFTLAGDLTFEPQNPDCLAKCFDHARENARQMRHCISTEMWSSLNRAYLGFKPLDLPGIWRSAPEEFYADVAKEFRAFFGVAEATMYRDESWHFLQLGRSVERAQLSISLLVGHEEAEDPGSADSEKNTLSLLRIFHAADSYTRRFGSEIDRAAAFDMIATDPMLPSSVLASCEAVGSHLSNIDPHPEAICADAKRSAGRLFNLFMNILQDSPDRKKILLKAESESRKLHDRIHAGYFDYA